MKGSLIITNAEIYTPVGNAAARGAAMASLRHIAGGEVEARQGHIIYVGPARPGYVPQGPDPVPVIDARGCALVPGFVDSHTHMIFAGDRADEFGWRLRGDSYMSIMERGGGIVRTVDATRRATAAELAADARATLSVMASMGVTTVEAKSGYGLDVASELRMLEAMRMLREDPLPAKADVVPTFMGAHAVPRGSDADTYAALVAGEMMDAVARQGVARHCDVFCERGVFSHSHTRRILEAARRAGLQVRLHADEMADSGTAALAASLGCLSADHLLHVSPEGVKALAASDTVATLLPLTAFTLREPYAPARALIDAGAAVALASDFNPGSCYSCSVPLIIALACIYMSMSVEEALTALTLNGAAALGLAADRGTIEVGKRADMALLCSPTPACLPYRTGLNSVTLTVCQGRVTHRNI